MDVTPEEAARTLIGRAAKRMAEVAARRDALRARLGDVAECLRERHGAERVVLFGSLAWGGFHARSDVDLAVEGVDGPELDRAAADVERLLPGVVVELFALEDLPASFRRRILDRGEALP